MSDAPASSSLVSRRTDGGSTRRNGTGTTGRWTCCTAFRARHRRRCSSGLASPRPDPEQIRFVAQRQRCKTDVSNYAQDACHEASIRDDSGKTYGCNEDAAILYKMFNAGNDVSMSGPRRLGKTFILDRLVDAAPDQDWTAVKVEVAGCSDARSFFRELCRKIGNQRSGGDRVVGWLRAFRATSRTSSAWSRR